MRQHHLFLAPGITLFSKASTLVVVVTLAASVVWVKKKQGSGRSPEILMLHWPFGLKYKAYKPSC